MVSKCAHHRVGKMDAALSSSVQLRRCLSSLGTAMMLLGYETAPNFCFAVRVRRSPVEDEAPTQEEPDDDSSSSSPMLMLSLYRGDEHLEWKGTSKSYKGKDRQNFALVETTFVPPYHATSPRPIGSIFDRSDWYLGTPEEASFAEFLGLDEVKEVVQNAKEHYKRAAQVGGDTFAAKERFLRIAVACPVDEKHAERKTGSRPQLLRLLPSQDVARAGSFQQVVYDCGTSLGRTSAAAGGDEHGVDHEDREVINLSLVFVEPNLKIFQSGYEDVKPVKVYPLSELVQEDVALSHVGNVFVKKLRRKKPEVYGQPAASGGLIVSDLDWYWKFGSEARGAGVHDCTTGRSCAWKVLKLAGGAGSGTAGGAGALGGSCTSRGRSRSASDEHPAYRATGDHDVAADINDDSRGGQRPGADGSSQQANAHLTQAEYQAALIEAEERKELVRAVRKKLLSRPAEVWAPEAGPSPDDGDITESDLEGVDLDPSVDVGSGGRPSHERPSRLHEHEDIDISVGVSAQAKRRMEALRSAKQAPRESTSEQWSRPAHHHFPHQQVAEGDDRRKTSGVKSRPGSVEGAADRAKTRSPSRDSVASPSRAEAASALQQQDQKKKNPRQMTRFQSPPRASRSPTRRAAGGSASASSGVNGGHRRQETPDPPYADKTPPPSPVPAKTRGEQDDDLAG
ncbi:unnamed protein product [Amoebophrya sp. A120]|nr:unnamed protein product [Amoebophrya sp. A120]|eukprot:GSA120T00021144001.1